MRAQLYILITELLINICDVGMYLSNLSRKKSPVMQIFKSIKKLSALVVEPTRETNNQAVYIND